MDDETAHLLTSPVNAARLMESIEQLEGYVSRRVFSGVRQLGAKASKAQRKRLIAALGGGRSDG